MGWDRRRCHRLCDDCDLEDAEVSQPSHQSKVQDAFSERAAETACGLFSNDYLDRLWAAGRHKGLNALVEDERESKVYNQIVTIQHDQALRAEAESWHKLDPPLSRKTAKLKLIVRSRILILRLP